jgi:porin
MQKILPLALLISASAQAEFSAVYTFDVASVLDGGIKRGTAFLDNIELSNGGTTSQGEWSGTLLYTNSNTFSDIYAGDGQVASNIDNTSMVRLYELWYRHDIASHSWQFGLIDLNGLYDAIDTAGLFLNSSHGIGPDFSQSGDNGPSIFPVTSLALNWQWQINEDVHWQVGVFDGVPGDPNHPKRTTVDLSSRDGALISSEINIQQHGLRYALGGWRYTATSEFIDGTDSAKNTGMYGIIEKPADDSENAFAWWLRAGLADSDINSVANYLGGGLTLQNFNAEHPDDVVGVAIAYASSSDRWRELDNTDSGETAIEVSYSRQINAWLRLQPDLQYVISPSADRGLDDAFIFILRAEFDLTQF